MASAIHTERLTKRYGETLALDSLDLDVTAGEVYGYLGPNGAGKTTTGAIPCPPVAASPTWPESPTCGRR